MTSVLSDFMLRDPEPAPCDDCRLRERFGREHLACDAYEIFLNGRSKTSWELAPRAPTRPRYLALRLDLDEAA